MDHSTVSRALPILPPAPPAPAAQTARGHPSANAAAVQAQKNSFSSVLQQAQGPGGSAGTPPAQQAQQVQQAQAEPADGSRPRDGGVNPDGAQSAGDKPADSGEPAAHRDDPHSDPASNAGKLRRGPAARPLQVRPPGHDAAARKPLGAASDADADATPGSGATESAADRPAGVGAKPADPTADPAALLANLAAAARAAAAGAAGTAAPARAPATGAAAALASAGRLHGASAARGPGNPDGGDDGNGAGPLEAATKPGADGSAAATPAAADITMDSRAATVLAMGSLARADGNAPDPALAGAAVADAAGALAAAASATNVTSAASATNTNTTTDAAGGHLVATPGSADFAPQLGGQISSFIRNGVQHARLELNPAEMGPLTVQIRVDAVSAQSAGQAPLHVHVDLASEHAQTRQALEQAMPALAGSLREAGLTLSGGGVFEQPRQPQPDSGSPNAGRGAAASGGGGSSRAAASPASDQPRLLRQRGVVDLVA